MKKEIAKKYLLEDIEKLKNDCINTCFANPELAKYYQSWMDQIINNCITDDRLWKWIENQINYCQEKERQYAILLGQILNEGLENSTKVY